MLRYCITLAEVNVGIATALSPPPRFMMTTIYDQNGLNLHLLLEIVRISR